MLKTRGHASVSSGYEDCHTCPQNLPDLERPTEQSIVIHIKMESSQSVTRD